MSETYQNDIRKIRKYEKIKKKLLQPREYEIRIEHEIANSIAGGKLLCVLKTLVLEPKHFCFRILVPMSIKMLRINEKCKPSVRRRRPSSVARRRRPSSVPSSSSSSVLSCVRPSSVPSSSSSSVRPSRPSVVVVD